MNAPAGTRGFRLTAVLCRALVGCGGDGRAITHAGGGGGDTPATTSRYLIRLRTAVHPGPAHACRHPTPLRAISRSSRTARSIDLKADGALPFKVGNNREAAGAEPWPRSCAGLQGRCGHLRFIATSREIVVRLPGEALDTAVQPVGRRARRPSAIPETRGTLAAERLAPAGICHHPSDRSVWQRISSANSRR